MRTRTAAQSASGRDISPLPRVRSGRRKTSCKTSFRKFCDTYFKEVFNIPWSDDHLKVIDKIERAVLAGGLFALAMPRGSGKTTLCEISALWAILYGHRKFICMIGASEDAAAQMVDSIKAEIEVNELLAADFPEVCYPIEKLDGIVNRTSGQLYKGKRTHITWTAKEIVLPSIPKSTASGAIVKCAGITGRIRGMKFKRPDGKSVRPDFVICDDPQTDESARSPSQCVTRETILATAILGLAGPGQKMSGIMPCTIIRDNDMAMRMLDREKHPEWQGELTKMVYKWPDATNLWDEYAERRAEELRSDGDGSQATAFYADNREEMDKGAIVSWYDRFNEDELSAIQHAYNLRIRDESAFFSEYQNAPVVDSEQSDILTTDEIAEKVNGLKRGEVPGDVDKLTCFIDIQQKVLFYTVVGFAPNFSGYVIDYGIYPDQKLRYFTLREVRTTLQQKKRGAGLEGAIFHGLETLTDKLHDTIYTRDDGAELLLDLTLIDANWGLTTDLVHQFCRNTKHRGKIMPAHGRYVGAASRPFNEYSRKKGERIGYNWRIPTVKGKRVVRHLLFDSNFWKSFLHARFAQPFGDGGSLTLFKAPNKPDNHFLDCLAGSCVAASVLGVKLSGLRMTPTKRDSDDVEDPKKYKRKRVTYLE